MRTFITILIISSSAFAQTTNSCEPCIPCCFFEQGLSLEEDLKPPCDVKYGPGYNAGANINVDSSWGLKMNAAFIYWYCSQDAMDIAYVAPVVAAIPTPGEVVYQSFGYQPGFKIGIGWDTQFDNWAWNAEYTWLYHSKRHTAVSPHGFSANDWFAPASPALNLYNTVSSIWGMHFDQIDVTLGRPYYEGTHLTIAPAGGVRVLLLHQGINVTMSNPLDVANPVISSTTYFHSWAVGPMIGVNSQWIFWKGLRADGVIGSSLLYARYTEIVNTQTIVGTGTIPPISSNYSAVRPTFDMGLGLGYGAYLFRNKLFIDLSARYDFAQFWSQNVIRNFTSQLAGHDDAVGDLRLHGLTVNLRCDF